MIEQTLLLIKPNVVVQKKIGKIISIIEDNGFEIKALEMRSLEKEFAERFYRAHRDKHFFNKLIEFMTNERTVAMLLEKEDAVNALRELAGDTDPAAAKEGSLRNLYGNDITKNAVHSSDSPENAEREIKLFFPDNF